MISLIANKHALTSSVESNDILYDYDKDGIRVAIGGEGIIYTRENMI